MSIPQCKKITFFQKNVFFVVKICQLLYNKHMKKKLLVSLFIVAVLIAISAMGLFIYDIASASEDVGSVMIDYLDGYLFSVNRSKNDNAKYKFKLQQVGTTIEYYMTSDVNYVYLKESGITLQAGQDYAVSACYVSDRETIYGESTTFTYKEKLSIEAGLSIENILVNTSSATSSLQVKVDNSEVIFNVQDLAKYGDYIVIYLKDLNLESGTHTIVVYAMGDEEKYLRSDASEIITILI